MGILKKIKKGLKKVAKPALGIGAAVLAAKALKGRGMDTGLTDGKFLMSGAAGGARLPKPFRRANMRDIAGSGDVMPGNLSSDMGMKRKQFMPGVVDYMSKGGRAGKKSKPKSIGKALRGGGKVIR